MRAVLLSVIALILSSTLLIAGNSLQFVVLALRAESEGFSVFVVGGMTTAYYLGYAAGTLRAPAIIDRIGHIRAFAASASVISAVVLAHGLYVDPAFWIGLRLVAGLCFAGLGTVIESWLNAKASRDVRGRLLSIATIAVSSGYAVGPLFAVLAQVGDLTLFVVASILMSVALVPVTLTRFSAPPVSGGTQPVERYGPLRLLRETPLGLIACAGTGVAQGAFFGFAAVFARRAGLDDAGASFFVTGALLAGALALYPLGWLSDRFDRRRVIALVALAVGLGNLVVAGLMVSVGTPFALVVVAAALGGIAAMPLYPIVIAYVNDRLSETSIMPAAATLILTFSVGSALAGPLGSYAIEQLGPAGLPAFFAAALLGIAAFTLIRMVLRPEEEGDEAPAPGVVVAGATLYELHEAQPSFDFDAPRDERTSPSG